MGTRSKKRSTAPQRKARAHRKKREKDRDLSSIEITVKKVGWSGHCGMQAIRQGDAMIITGSEEAIRKAGEPFFREEWDYELACFEHIALGLQAGNAYAFDEAAYQVFLPLAREQGFSCESRDVSDPGPFGLRLTRVELSDPLFCPYCLLF